MRNLVLVADSVIVLDNVNISATAVDLDENVIYAVSEKQNFDGDVDVELWKFGKIESSELIGVCYTSVLKHKCTYTSDQEPSLIAMFSTVASSRGPKTEQVIALRVIAETRRIVVITRGGDITTISLEDTEPLVCSLSS